VKEAMMENTPLFSALTEEQRSVIAERMVEERRRAGDVIYQQGAPATAMYLVRSGWARLVTEQFAVLANLGPGSLLGDADTVTGRNYSSSAEAASDVSLWTLHAADLRTIMDANPSIARALKSAFGISEDQAIERHLRRLELMAGLSPDALREIAGHMHPQQFPAGQVVYKEGSAGDSLFIIEQGQVQVQAGGVNLGTTSRGETFGEGAFLTGEPRSTTVTAVTDITAWSLGRTDYESLALRHPTLALNLSRLVTRRLRERTLRSTARVEVIPAPQYRAVQPVRTAEAPSPAVTGSLTGLNRVSSSATSWWGDRSTGAKIRLIAVVVLLIWLLGVAAPSVIISLLGRSSGESQSQMLSQADFRQRAVLVAMAADLPVDVTPTYTPWPTETPIPTPTFTPTATPTNTPIPTATFTPTSTPVPPTNTPVPPTATPRPVLLQAAAPAPAPVAAVARVAAAPAAPKAAPAPSVQFKLAEARRLSPCENRGMHNIFVKVVDGAGNPVDGVVLVQSPNGQYGNVIDKAVTGSKGPGLAEFIMWKGAEYSVYVSGDGANPGSTDIANSLHSNFVDEAECASGGGGNTLFHNSFSVIFVKNF
jgi:CRP-like cAMP-binding protein